MDMKTFCTLSVSSCCAVRTCIPLAISVGNMKVKLNTFTLKKMWKADKYHSTRSTFLLCF